MLCEVSPVGNCWMQVGGGSGVALMLLAGLVVCSGLDVFALVGE